MFDDIKQFFDENKIPKFRYKQLEDAYFKQFVTSFDEITTYPKDLREKLNKKFSLCSLELVQKYESNSSVKFVLKTKDGYYIETILMKHQGGRRTVCVSSQIFCSLKCKFCATGANSCKRNLKYQEIVEQVLFVNNYLKQFEEKVTNVVFMGMGEPFLNYNQVIKTIQILNDEKCFNIGARHITVSTAGIVPRISEFANLGLQIRLAISLHAPNDKLRSYLMPINDKYNLKELFEAVDYFISKTNKRVSFEYVLIKGVNDSEALAKELVELLNNRLAHVNLLIYNSHEFSEFEKPDKKTVLNFKKILDQNGVGCSIRKSLGDDISGACGQLAGKK